MAGQGSHCPNSEEDEREARSSAAFAHSNYAEQYFLKKDYPRAHRHSAFTLQLDGYWEQWPFYCTKYQAVFAKSGYNSNVQIEPKYATFAASWMKEVKVDQCI